MGIGSVTSMNSMSDMPVSVAGSTDSKSKNIQNEITSIQQEIQGLSSKEELSVEEKANERKKLQKEATSLNAELKRHQEELRKSQKREIMMAELQGDVKPAEKEKSKDRIQADGPEEKETVKNAEKTADSGMNTVPSRKEMPAAAPAGASVRQTGGQEAVIAQSGDGIVILKGELNQEKRGVDAGKKQEDESGVSGTAEEEAKTMDSNRAADTGLSGKKMAALASADTSVQQAGRQETVIARIRGGIAVLKGEINQDEIRGADTDKKQEELEELEKKEQRARTFQFSVLGQANDAMKASADNVSGTNSTQIPAENNAFANALNAPNGENQELQQMFHVSFS